jgi:hypothetical protein
MSRAKKPKQDSDSVRKKGPSGAGHMNEVSAKEKRAQAVC